MLLLLLTVFALYDTTYAYEVKNQMPWKNVQNTLKLMEGHWYNDDGQMVLSVEGNYINGCEVVSAYDFAGASNFATGIFYIRESKGTRQVKIGWNIYGNSSDYITFDEQQMLHRNQNYYYESIAGIHLGMSAKNAEKNFGKPTRKVNTSSHNEKWYYDDKGIEVSFECNGISNITILKSCKLKFSKSGLNCQNSPQEYRRIYQWQTLPHWNNKFLYYNVSHHIGYGEYIYLELNMKSVTLTLYAS